MSPGKRQLAWSCAWLAACAALVALHHSPGRAASFVAALAAAVALKSSLKNRSSLLGLAVAVCLLGLTAGSVANLTSSSARVRTVAPLLGGATIVFLAAQLADALARRRALAVRALVAAALAVPVAWAVTLLAGYTAFSTARIPILLVKIPLSDPFGRALGVARVAFQLAVALPLMCGAIAGLRTDRSRA